MAVVTMGDGGVSVSVDTCMFGSEHSYSLS